MDGRLVDNEPHWAPFRRSSDRFVTASVLDPFGNILGLIESPHYLARLT